jgi:Carboxylesterase family
MFFPFGGYSELGFQLAFHFSLSVFIRPSYLFILAMVKPPNLNAFAMLLLTSSPVSASSCLPEATIASEVVIGTTTSLPSATATVNKFLGIPFAASPPERLYPPTQPTAWATSLNASAWMPACVQQFNCGFRITISLCIELILHCQIPRLPENLLSPLSTVSVHQKARIVST